MLPYDERALSRSLASRVVAPYYVLMTTSPRAQYQNANHGAGPRLFVFPTLLRRRLTITHWGLAHHQDLSGLGGSLFRLGQYADDGSFYPGALVTDSGDVSFDGTTFGFVGVARVATIEPGLWWWAVEHNAITLTNTQSWNLHTQNVAGTVDTFDPYDEFRVYQIAPNGGGVDYQSPCLGFRRQLAAYGALPDPFGVVPLGVAAGQQVANMEIDTRPTLVMRGQFT